jgi:DNA-binding NtrC family response regulator
MDGRAEEAGHRVLEASEGAYAVDLLRERSFDLVVCELALARVPGLSVLRHVRRESPHTAVIMTAASATVDDAVAALKEGALDFLVKPLNLRALLGGVVARLAERRALKSAFDVARAQLVGRIVGAALLGDSPPMQRVLERIDTVAASDCAVLVSGETGTGKDIVARTIYARSRRAGRPFVTVDCTRGAATERELLEPGGQLAAAQGGTIFFDEVAELPLGAQARLVAAMHGPEGLGARCLSATHHDLEARVAQGAFRSDLFFQLRTVGIEMPPLRERKADLSLLVRHLLERLTPPGLVPPGVGPRAWAALEAHDFPGNVRELARAVEHAMALAHGCEIDREHLPVEIALGAGAQSASIAPMAVARRHFEREYARRALAACGGDLERAAELLAIAPESLERKLGGRFPRRRSAPSFPSSRRGPAPRRPSRAARAATTAATSATRNRPTATGTCARARRRARARLFACAATGSALSGLGGCHPRSPNVPSWRRSPPAPSPSTARWAPSSTSEASSTARASRS